MSNMAALPQLESSTFFGQLFWLFITFFVLYFAISKVFLPKISGILKKREEYENSLIHKASSLQEKFKQMNFTHKNILANAKSQSMEIMKNASFKMSDIKSEFEKKLENSIKNENDKFKLDLKNDFELNKIRMYNDYLQLNELFAKTFFSSQVDPSREENQDVLSKENFEKHWMEKRDNLI